MLVCIIRKKKKKVDIFTWRDNSEIINFIKSKGEKEIKNIEIKLRKSRELLMVYWRYVLLLLKSIKAHSMVKTQV